MPVIYTPYDENNRRETFYSEKLTKTELYELYDKLEHAYSAEFRKNQELTAEIHKLKEVIKNLQQSINKHNTDLSGTIEKAIVRIVDREIQNKLSLDEDSIEYGGNYLRLSYGNKDLGCVCLEAYSDD